ncbi:MAG: DUF1416 domain-containing protein [Streptosporangiales bacterium]|nr:DUF1416 domain-containing protein [Streptosporangiales bacterium]
MSDQGCGAPTGGAAVTDAGNQAIIQGTVTKDGAPVNAYARLLNADGDFVGEVPTGSEGTFRFFAASGTWTVRVLAAGGFTQDYPVQAELGTIKDLEVTVA